MKKLWPTLFIFSLFLNFHLYKKSVNLEKQSKMDQEIDLARLNKKILKNHTQDKLKFDEVKQTQSALQSTTNYQKIEDIAEDLNQEFSDISNYEGGTIDISTVMEEFEEAGKKFFEESMNLGPDAYEKYLTVKKDYEKDMQEFSNKFSKELQDYESFVPTQDQIIEQTKIMEKTLAALKASLGEENYNKYMKFVHRFNQELVRRSPNGAPSILISF